MITRHARVLVCQSLIGLISFAALAGSADAAVMVGLLIDPPTTAGGGATSTLSGAGTWHVYALDNSSFGLTSYDVTLTGATSNSNRSPTTNVLDHNGDPQTAGFSLRSVANSNPFYGGQNSITPFKIKGLGQEASDFTTKTSAIDPASTVVGPTVSGSWGVYSSPAVAPLNGRNWLFLAEGTYNVGNSPTISKATFTVYANAANFNTAATQTVIVTLPEPATIGLIGLGAIAGFSLIRRSRAKTFVVSLLLATAIAQSSANAAVIVGLLLDPPSTAGGGATSTRSGPNTWHIYAVDDNTGDFGISVYNIQMTNVVAVNHRSPLTTIVDSNGDPQPAGFSLLRTGTNSNPIQASQSLPGTTPFLIKGFGQEASNFAAKAAAIDPLGFVAGPTISGAWGTYNTIAPYHGKNWLFIAEGTYNAGILPTISRAVMSVYIDATTFSSNTSPSTIILIPEPATIALLAMAGIGVLGLTRCRRAAIGLRSSLRNAARRAGVLLACLVSIVASTGSADAAVIFNLLVNPATTAGPGVTSTRSGVGSWHLYAVDDNADDFGISSYSVTMVNTTAINHRSPVTTIEDSNGDPQTSGFNLLRTATNANPIQAAQNFPDQTPFLIKGFGQIASSFATVAATAPNPPNTVIGPTTSPTWGNYNNGVTTYNGKEWLFIAEGLYNTSGSLPAVTAATVTVYNADFTSKFSTVVIPEPAGFSLVGLALVSLIGFTRRRSLH